MSDNETNKKAIQEEYQFPDEDSASAQAAMAASDSDQPSQSASPINPEMINRIRRLSMLIFLFMLIFSVMHFFRGSKSEDKTKQTSDKVAVNQTPTTTTQAQTSTGNSKGINQESNEIKQLNDTVVELRQNLMLEDSRLHKLELHLGHVDDAITNIGGRLSDFQLQMQSLIKQIKNLQMAKSFPKAVRTRRPARMKKPPKIHYTLTALVRGRAWVRGPDGGNLTVKVGDNLYTYGVVRAIDPIQGLIETSSGRLITYGNDDA